MVELEAGIERRIVRYVEALGGYALKLVILNVIGFPDRTILLPGGRILFVEIKRTKMSKTYHMQKIWKKRLNRLGFVCEFVQSVEEVEQLIESL